MIILNFENCHFSLDEIIKQYNDKILRTCKALNRSVGTGFLHITFTA